MEQEKLTLPEHVLSFLYSKSCYGYLQNKNSYTSVCEANRSIFWTVNSYDHNNFRINPCLLPLTLWVRIPLRRSILDTTLCNKVCQWLTAGRWFSPGTPVSSTNKTDRADITEILLKVALNTIILILKNKDVTNTCYLQSTIKNWIRRIVPWK